LIDRRGVKLTKITVSILGADFSDLRAALAIAEAGGGDLLHLDVMDGAFVPLISYGSPIVKSLVGKTKLPFDVHIMAQTPERQIESLITKNTECIVVHQESDGHLDRILNDIKSRGIKCGVALNPSTHPDTIEYVGDIIDRVLVMSVNPGYSGQVFIPSALDKIKAINEMRKEHEFKYEISVDGGISKDNVADIISVGADIVVAGSSIFSKADPVAELKAFRSIVDASSR
jgi:ribulose-phosphate 3-epimerase